MADREDLGTTLGSLPTDRATGDPAPRVEPPERRFELGDELGRGGMGRVVAARDRELGRPVAIKQILSRAPEHVARFEREIRITAQLEHPSIVPIHEAGRDEHGVPYYVMRQIQGEPLGQRLARAGDAERLALLPNVLAAIDAAAFAHARGIIHRDIKPGNILLGEHGATLLIDWGLARQLDTPDDEAPATDASAPVEQGLTTAGAAYGTPGYMSPEQARGEPVDRRTDVYALGATLFHLLAGKPPYAASTAGEQLALAVLGEPPPLAELHGAPPELVAIVGKAMAPAAAARYPDAGAMAADVRAFLAGQLVGAHRYTRRERVVRFVRRHRVAVLLATLALVAGAVALVVIVRSRSSALAAMHEAQARQQQLEASMEDRLLDHAEQLAQTDPTRAVALLRELSPTSPRLPRGRDIAATAAAHGIAHGSSFHAQLTSALAISPAGRWLASADDDGTVAIHELASARSRLVERFAEAVTSLAWLAEDTLVLGGLAEGIVLFDLTTGKRRTVAAGVRVQNHHLWVTPSGMLWVLDTDHHLREVSPSTGDTRVLASDVDNVVVDGDVALLAGKSVRVLDAQGLHEVPTAAVPGYTGAMAISREHDRFAIADELAVLEWDLARPTATPRRWTLPSPTMLLKYGASLHAIIRGGTVYTLGATVLSVASLGPAIVIASRVREGLVIASTAGPITLVSAAGAVRLGDEQGDVRMIAAHRGASRIAVGSLSGHVRWWDLETILPQSFELSGPAEICDADDRTILVTTTLDLVEIDRTSGAQRTVAAGVGRCLVRRGDRVAIDGPEGLEVLDLKTAARLRVSGVADLKLDHDGTIVVARGDRLLAIDLPGRERELWRAPTSIEQLAINGGWLLVLLQGGMWVRLERATLTPAALYGPHLQAYLVLPSGVVWYASERALWRWDGYSLVQVRDLPSPVSQFTPVAGGVGFALRDGSLWFADDHGVVNRAGPDGHRRVRLHAERATAIEGKAIVSRSLAHGSSRILHPPHASSILAFDRTLVAQAGPHIIVYDAPPSDEIPDLHAWLEAATNAAIAPASGELVWR